MMRGAGMMLAVMTPLLIAAAPAPKPASWIDATTGHRIVRVDDRPGNYGLYFNYNPFTPDGKRMIYLTPEGIRVADTTDWTTTLVLKAKIDRLLFVGNRTPVAYYSTSPVGNEAASTIWSVDLDTGRRRRIADLPGGRIASINADDTLLAGHRELSPPPAAIAAQGNRDPKTGSPTYAANGPDGRPLPFAQAKELWMAKRLAAGVPMEIFTIDIRTGERRTVTQSNDWLNHVLFSPSDPTLLSYCHEGPWQKVDRIWTIRTDGSQKTKVHQRMFQGEIAGHEYWAPDGRTIWYDLIQPMGVRWLASLDVVSGKRVWYALRPGQGSFHYSSSPDSRVFSGDGNDEGKYISLFRPRADANPRARDTLDGDTLIASGDLETQRIADLSKQDYTLEPNQHFTPDGKWLVYRANIEGKPAIYAVEIAKAP